MFECYDVVSPGIKPGPHPMESVVVKCPYCGENARKALGKEVFPYRKKVAKKKFFVCLPCDARVGCHDNGGFKWKPLGSMANRKLRRLRQAAHAAFDPLWKGLGDLKPVFPRAEAYKWLALEMGLSVVDTHIGEFNEEQCARVVAICKQRTLGIKST